MQKKKIVQFGIAFGMIFIIIAARLFLKNNMKMGIFLSVIGCFIIIITLTFPFILLPIYKLIVKIASVLNWINTRIILGIVFYFLLTPIGLFRKIFCKNDFDMNFKKVKMKETYWIKRKNSNICKESLENQF